MNYQNVIEITGGLQFLNKYMDKKDIRILCFKDKVMILNAEFPLLLEDYLKQRFEREYGFKFDLQSQSYNHHIEWCQCHIIKPERTRIISGVLCHVDCGCPIACHSIGKKLHPAEIWYQQTIDKKVPKCKECAFPSGNGGLLRF